MYYNLCCYVEWIAYRQHLYAFRPIEYRYDSYPPEEGILHDTTFTL